MKAIYSTWSLQGYTATLEAQECTACGIVFAMPDSLVKQRRSDGVRFYCPNGHWLAYTKTDSSRLREERERSVQLVAQLDQANSALMDKAKEISRMKRRAKAGLCQFCRRHFANVEAHVDRKHPGR